MALQEIQKIQPTGLTPVTAAAEAGGETFETGDLSGANVFLFVKNTDASAHDVILVDQTSQAPTGADAFDADITVNVAAGGEVMVGPVSARRFADADGLVHVNWSAATGMELAVIRL